MEQELKLPDLVKNIVFVAEGGLGRVIASTAVLAQVAKCFPDKKLIVVSGSIDVFLYNPHVASDSIYSFHNPLHFYDRYVTPESYIMHVEPYRHTGFLHGDTHLIDAWCDLIGIPRPENKKPELYFLKKELEGSRIFYDTTVKVEAGKIKESRKLAVLQWVGGKVPPDSSPQKLLEVLGTMHKRSMPKLLAQQIVNSLSSRGYEVVSLQGDNFPKLDGVKECRAHIRNVMALLHHADAFIGIDSFAQHALAAVGKPGLVFWGGTHPARLGYPIHTNMNKVQNTEGHLGCKMPNCHRPNSYIFDMNPSGFAWNCPYDEVCMDYTLTEVLAAFDKLYPKTHSNQKKPKKQKEEASTEKCTTEACSTKH